MIQGKQIADLAITTAKIDATAVTTAKLGPNAVTPLKADLTQVWGFTSLTPPTATAAPVSANDLTNKAYVDAVASGLDVKASCLLTTVAALPANTPAGAGVGKTLTMNAVGILTVDGVATLLGDRILVKSEVDPIQNGIYTVTVQGTALVAAVLTRATDFDTNAEVTDGAFTFIEQGTVNADSGWVLTTNNPIIVDTTGLVFAQFSGAGTYTAGNGLQLVGSIFSVLAADASIVAAPAGTSVGFSAGLPNSNDPTAAAAAGVAVTPARLDHQHQTPTAAPINVGTANATGAAASLSRSDHVHATPVAQTGTVNMSASVTVNDEDAATATAVPAANALSGAMRLFVNGVEPIGVGGQPALGNGTKVASAYIAAAATPGVARAWAAVAATDTIQWNGSIAGFQLDANDRIDLVYDSF
jgi:hypothetical protein